jgi:predicted nucleic acid-binding protein
MKKLKLYLDEKTSPREMDEMQQLWELIGQGDYEAAISSVVIDELMALNNHDKRSILLDFMKQVDYEIVEITDEIHATAKSIVRNGILSDKNYNDCLHIACAILSGCDCLVSFNFKHLVNIKTIKGARAISSLQGYSNIDIVPAVTLIQKGDE